MLGISSNGKGSHDVVHVDNVSCLNCFRKMFRIIFRVHHVKIQSHVVNMKTRYFGSFWLTESDNTFKIYHTVWSTPVLHSYFEHFIVLGEFFYVVTRVTVKAQRRKNERKMEKAKLLEKPLLPPANDGEEKV